MASVLCVLVLLLLWARHADQQTAYVAFMPSSHATARTPQTRMR
jgi:hypothetical protein